MKFSVPTPKRGHQSLVAKSAYSCSGLKNRQPKRAP